MACRGLIDHSIVLISMTSSTNTPSPCRTPSQAAAVSLAHMVIGIYLSLSIDKPIGPVCEACKINKEPRVISKYRDIKQRQGIRLFRRVKERKRYLL